MGDFLTTFLAFNQNAFFEICYFFAISLYIANFLSDNEAAAKQIFKQYAKEIQFDY